MLQSCIPRVQRAFKFSEELTGWASQISTTAHQWWEIEDILPGYDFKRETASAAPGQQNRLLQLQQASRTRVPLTHATVYWSGLWIVACCSGALGPHTSHCQSVFCLNLQTSPFSPNFVSDSAQTGCFWLTSAGDWHLLWIYNKINFLTASPNASVWQRCFLIFGFTGSGRLLINPSERVPPAARRIAARLWFNCRRQIMHNMLEGNSIGDHLVNWRPHLRDWLIDQSFTEVDNSWQEHQWGRSLVSDDSCVSWRRFGLCGLFCSVCRGWFHQHSHLTACFSPEIWLKKGEAGVYRLPQMIQWCMSVCFPRWYHAPGAPSRQREDVWLCCNESMKGPRVAAETSPSHR